MDALAAGLRPLGEQFMDTDVTITRRQTFAKDDANPFGDDTTTLASTSTTVKGWVVGKPTTTFSEDASQVVQVGLTIVRVPFGTAVEPGDKVRLKDTDYTVVDSSAESDLAVWVLIYLRRIQ